MKKSELRQMIKEELLKEDLLDVDKLDPKSGLAVLISEPYEGMSLYGVKDVKEAEAIRNQLKSGDVRSFHYLVKIVKKY